MIEIKNLRDEAIEILDSIDTTVAGCRIQSMPHGPIIMQPGQVIALLGYEPGVSYVIRPVLAPHIPREGLDGLIYKTN